MTEHKLRAESRLIACALLASLTACAQTYEPPEPLPKVQMPAPVTPQPKTSYSVKWQQTLQGLQSRVPPSPPLQTATRPTP